LKARFQTYEYIVNRGLNACGLAGAHLTEPLPSCGCAFGRYRKLAKHFLGDRLQKEHNKGFTERNWYQS
jgi:hypothetical protein